MERMTTTVKDVVPIHVWQDYPRGLKCREDVYVYRVVYSHEDEYEELWQSIITVLGILRAIKSRTLLSLSRERQMIERCPVLSVMWLAPPYAAASYNT